MARIPHNVLRDSVDAKSGKTNWAQLGVDAARGGNYEAAIDLFVTAIAQDRRNAGLRHNLGIALECAGQIDDAAVSLTEALRLKRRMPEAAQRLSRLLARYQVEEPGRLDPAGLRNAFGVEGAAEQDLGRIAFDLLADAGPLGESLARGRKNGWDDVAKDLLTPKTAPLLRDELFLTALARHINQSRLMEHLLCALRRQILVLEPEHFFDKDLLAFSIALANQCQNNEHVFDISDEERSILGGFDVPFDLTAKPSPITIKSLVVLLLYFPLEKIFGPSPNPKSVTALRPKSLRDFVAPLLAGEVEERITADNIVRAGTLSDVTSQRVADQYERRPYPRWTSLIRPRDGSLVKALERFVPRDRLGFTAQPFDVLIAGCGTGRHAIQSTIGYGPNARVTAIDLSLRSLSYAQRAARRYKVDQISFVQADLLDPHAFEQDYHVIECVGVLHHLAEPIAGLRMLVERLRPGGLMHLGLYSAVSREELSALREEPGFPGTACSDGAARIYRAQLRDRDPEVTGGELTNSIDFWSLSGFRDLVLHVSEQQFTLPDIRRALDELGLRFRGFNLPPQLVAGFEEAFPDDPWPGSLENWWRYEQEEPRLFDAMYSFWAEKPT